MISKSPVFKRGLKNASFLAGGNIISEVLTFLTFTLIARKFDPGNYGIYATVTNYVSMFEIFALQGLNKTVIREGALQEHDFVSVLRRGLKLKYLFVIAASLLCLLILPFVDYDMNTKLFILFFAVSILLHEVMKYFNVVFMVKEKMSYISYLGIASRIFFLLMIVLVVVFNGNVFHLLIANVLTLVVVILLTLYFARRLVKGISIFVFPAFNKEYFKTALIFSLFSAVTMLSTKFDLFIISVLGDSMEVGFYAVAYKIAIIALMLRNVNQDAFYPIMIKRLKKGPIRKSLLITSAFLIFIVLAGLTFAFSFVIEDIVIFIFGESYAYSASILVVLMYFLCFAYATLPFTLAAQASYNEKTMLKVRILMAALNIILDVVFYHYFGLIGIAYVSVIVWGIGSPLMCYTIFRQLKLKKVVY